MEEMKHIDDIKHEYINVDDNYDTDDDDLLIHDAVVSRSHVRVIVMLRIMMRMQIHVKLQIDMSDISVTVAVLCMYAELVCQCLPHLIRGGRGRGRVIKEEDKGKDYSDASNCNRTGAVGRRLLVRISS